MKNNEIKISVIGLGYIGLPTALILSVSGYTVIGTDVDKSVIQKLNSGDIGFHEPGMEELYVQACERDIVFTEEYIATDVYIIAVPTPYEKVNRKVDAVYVENAVKNVLDVCPENGIIVIESTVSPGTIDKHIRPLIKNGRKAHLAHAPERIIPGSIIKELRENSRTIGADSDDVREKVKEIYQSFCKGIIVTTDIRTAEMTKVVENTYRDVNIAFANELAKICHTANLDVYEIIRIANMHPRVNILTPGPGVGGHCISVDPWFLVGDYPGLANIILAARKINDSMPEFVLERTAEIMRIHYISDTSKVGFYGLTYKEDVDDVRESPTLQLIDKMQKHLSGSVKVYDPYINKKLVSNQIFDLKEFLDAIDIVVIMVGHRQIIEKQDLLRNKIVLDTRHVINIENIYYL